MLHVLSARSLGGYRVFLRLSDGDEGVADLSGFLWGPVFEALKDPAEFARLRISELSGALEWPNGADLAPEALKPLLERS
jgi:hypothetical protein